MLTASAFTTATYLFDHLHNYSLFIPCLNNQQTCMSNRKKKEPPAKEMRAQDTLIEKSQVNKPRLDEEMEKILNSIVMGIRNCPPAQPKRKYQKSADIESTMDKNIRSIAETPLLSEKQRFMINDSLKHAPSLLKEMPSFDAKSRSKEVSQRSEEMKSNYSVNSHTSSLSISKVDPIAKQISNIEPSRKETPNKDKVSQIQIKDSKQSAETKSKVDQQQSNPAKDKQKESPNLLPYNPRKRHIGQGMKLMKLLPKGTVIDLDSDDPGPQQTKPQTTPPSTDPQ